MFAASKTDGSSELPDPQFNYVTMLLHGDGTNGAQNNTFLDSSTNNFTITRNGNTTQGSFSPYGSNWSNYFDGSSYLNTSSSNELIASGNGFTIEAWVYYTAITNFSFIAASTTGAGSYNPYWFIGSSNTGNWRLSWGNATSVDTGIAITLNTWNHVAISMTSGGAGTFYVNGVSRATTTGISLNGLATGVAISHGGGGISGLYQVNGYISNVRYVKNSSVYTSNFTPSTTPLTAITGTSFLSCQSNRFIDNSAIPLTITATGTPSVQRFNPFGTSTAYSTSVIGGSAYFDGSGDYLSIPSATAAGSGSFSFESWIYMQNVSAPQMLFANASSGGMWIGLNIDGTNRLSLGRVFTAIDKQETFNWVINTWYHIVVNRSGTNLQFFVNGVQVGTTSTNSVDYSISGRLIGAESTGASYFYGYVSGLRFVNASVYTTAFTPPTSPPTAIANTTVLTNFTNGAIYDNAMMNDLETVGNAQISTSVVKYGTGSLAFDGTGDYLQSARTITASMGTGNFTIEGWFYASASPSYWTTLISLALSTSAGHEIRIGYGGLAATGLFGFLYPNSANNDDLFATVSSNPSLNTWYHFALVRNGTNMVLYLNGTSAATASSVGFNHDGTIVYVGANPYPDPKWNGYIDDLRITKGYARYTANFTPPTSAFPNTGPI